MAEQPWYILIAATLAVYYVFAQLRVYMLCKRLNVQPPPVRQDRFFGFNTLRILLTKGLKGEMPEFSKDQLNEFGLHTIALRLAGKRVIMTKDPENMKAILATQFNDFVLGTRHKCVKILLGDGIFTLDGSGWKHSRAMLRPQFAREQVGHVESLEPRVQALVKQIRKADGRSFDIQPLFFKLTVDSGTDFLFGESCDSLSEGLASDTQLNTGGVDPQIRRDFPDAFNYAQNMLNIRMNLQNLFWLGWTSKFDRCKNVVHDFTQFYVDRALQMLEKELDEASRGGYVFLFELLKQTRDPVILRDQCLNILLAARDTTAGLLSFTFYELARNPEIFAKLRSEIQRSFGLGEDADLSLISFESLKKCEYLKWVLNEALRMYPSVPRNFRVATRDTTLPRGGGPDQGAPVLIEKGMLVSYSVYASHREPQYFGKDAETFRPERWGEPFVNKLGWAFLPFNGGPRICLGQQFALTEASYVIVRLLQTFSDIKSFDVEYPPKLLVHLTMSLMEGANISLA